MKTFQKITLAAAISAAPFMSQAMEALDDTVLGNTTGQAGVTIEIDIADAGVTIGEIEYTDTAVAGTDGGSVLLQNINITNADLTQTIDVDADGSLVLGISDLTDLTVKIGNVAGANSAASAVALKSVNGAVTEVVNDVSLVMDLKDTTTTLVNLQETGAAAKYGVTASFDNGTDPVSNSWEGSLAIIADAQVRITDLDVGMFGYTQDQANTRANVSGALANLGTARSALEGNASVVNVTYTAVGTVDKIDVGAGLVDKTDASVAGVAAEIGDADTAAVANATAVGTSSALANGSAVQLENVRFYGEGGENTFASVKQTIWAKGGTVAQGGGVYISVGEIKGTLDIGAINMGQASIGQVKVSGIDLGGMTQRIYGH